MIQARQTGSLHNHGETLTDLPIGILGHFLLAPIDHIAALLDGLIQTAGSDGHHRALTALAQALEDLQHITLFHVVLFHHGAVVDAQLIRQLRHSHHDAIGALRRTVALVGACGRRVGVIHLQIVGHIVHLEQGHGLGAAVHRHRQAVVAVGAGIGTNLHKQGRDGAILLAAHLHVHAHGMAGGVGIEFLGTGVAVIHRLLGDPSSITGEFLHQNILLRSVTAAHTLLDDMDLVLGNAADPAHNAPHMVRHLGGAVQHQTSALHMGIAHMGLQRGVLDLTGLVSRLHNGIRLGKALLHVADAALVGGSDILMNVSVQRELVNHLALTGISLELVILLQILRCAGIILHGAVMHQRCPLGHGLLHGEHSVGGFILHLNEGRGLIGDLGSTGHDARHTVAHMAYLHVKQPAVMGRGLGRTLTGLHIVHIRAVKGGDDGRHAVQLLCFTGVNGLDISAGKGAAQNMQAPGIGGHLVLHEHRLTGNQSGAVDLPGRLADDVQLGAERRSDLRLEFAEITQLAGQLHCQIIVLITGITDKDTGHHILDLLAGGVGMLLQQPGENQRRRRGVVGALHDTCGHHGLLHIVQLTVYQQRLRCFDLSALRLVEHNKVGIFQFAVKDDGIGAGKALGVVAVAHGVAAGMIQHLTQPNCGLALQHDILAV